jgi:enamine deaminase RidA (YjgF/YER057c/UK114 family)
VITHFERPDGLGPVNGYSHATTASGRLVAVSGQLPVDASGAIVSADPLAQARQVFTNLAIALRAAGAGPADVLRFNYYVLDLDDVAVIRTARDEFLGGTADALASSLVQVAGLVLPGARFEIDALAVVQS